MPAVSLLVCKFGFEFHDNFMQQTHRKRIGDLLFHGTITSDLGLPLRFLFASVHCCMTRKEGSCFGV